VTPRNSGIGYLHYEGAVLPITAVRLFDGDITFVSQVLTDSSEKLSVDQNAACTVMGVDGTQIMWVPRTGAPDILTACFGGWLTVVQKLQISSSERMSL
jgi:methylthioribose-1-phosphate isomerase